MWSINKEDPDFFINLDLPYFKNEFGNDSKFIFWSWSINTMIYLGDGIRVEESSTLVLVPVRVWKSFSIS